MKLKMTLLTLIFVLSVTLAFSQNPSSTAGSNSNATIPAYKFSVSTTYLSFINFGEEKTNTHHYELHFEYKLTPKDKIGIKAATWKLFAPMGIQLWDPLFLNESEFFPGRLSESGLGMTYQRFLWKGLFAQLEVLPLWKQYLDATNKKIGDGFKLYTTYHFGYHIPLFKNRLYLEPQIHCNYWPIDTKAPQGFEAKESRWQNYFLFEPDLYIGVNF